MAEKKGSRKSAGKILADPVEPSPVITSQAEPAPIDSIPVNSSGKDPAVESVPVDGESAGPVLDEAPPEGEDRQEHPVEDPVEILVGLAERGEIDPWNINIIEVTDKFLNELEHRRELNLKISGRTLFFAATLLRLKSEQLELLANPEPEEEEGDDDLFGGEFGDALDSEIDYNGRLGPIERLEHEIQRRLDRKNMRKSPVTLFELILELKNIEKEERRRRRMNAPDDSFLYDADDVVSIAHEEGYQESSLTILAEFLEHVEVGSEMTLADLCKELGWGIPEVYIPLLFLAHEGRCEMRQDTFFGDVFVQICRVEVAELASEPAAE
jgi:segregation and condensation protein A